MFTRVFHHLLMLGPAVFRVGGRFVKCCLPEVAGSCFLEFPGKRSRCVEQSVGCATFTGHVTKHI